MGKQLTSFILGFVLVLIIHPPLHAQTAANAPLHTQAAPTNQTPAGLAPDEVMKKLSDLVHAGKYAEAQQLTTGLLMAYPDDQRLIKAKALLDKSPASAGSTSATPASNPPASSAASAQPAAGTNAEPLTGMDKVEYNSLFEMARQAQQTTDLEQQKVSLRQFMIESKPFLQKHPDDMLLWQIRGMSAISLDDPDAGYEAGQKLLAAGAADSNDLKLQQLLSKLKIKGWLDKQKVENYKKYGWILGTWSISWSTGDQPDEHGSGDKEVFLKSATGDVEGHYLPSDGPTQKKPDFKGAILVSGEINWEHYLPTSRNDPESPGTQLFVVNDDPGKQRYPNGWQPPISYFLSEDKRTMTLKFTQQTPNPKRKWESNYILQHPAILTFVKVSDAQSQ